MKHSKLLKPFLNTGVDGATPWAGMDDHQADALRARLKEARAAHDVVGLCALAAGFVLALSLLGTEVLENNAGTHWLTLAVLLAATAAACLVIGALVGKLTQDLLGSEALRTLEFYFSPLQRHSELCFQAEEALQASAGARAYRDRVIAGGRELMVGDYWCMWSLSQKDQSEGLAAKLREVCKRVHGLERQPA